MPVAKAGSGSEQASEADLDPALDEPDQALGLLGGKPELGAQPAHRVLAKLIANAIEPACRGRPVHRMDPADLVDPEAVEQVHAQHVAIANLERGDRLLERSLDLVALQLLDDVVSLGRAEHHATDDRGVVDEVEPMGRSPEIQGGSHRGDPDQRTQIAVAGEVEHAGAVPGVRDEQLLAQDLADLVDHGPIGADSRQHGAELAEIASVERTQGLGSSGRARAGDVEVRDRDGRESLDARRRGLAARDVLRDQGHDRCLGRVDARPCGTRRGERLGPREIEGTLVDDTAVRLAQQQLRQLAHPKRHRV
ncbi:MAG: hypothetical protein JWP01_451 [Myxococcales bacterium]|nr:hypothetical protein [Myxococcales bacterium]